MKFTSRRWLRVIGTPTLAILLTFHVLSGERLFTPVYQPNAQTETTLTLTTDRDAFVRQSYANTNYGSASWLQVDGAGDPDTESFIHFTVTGVAGTIQSARLRVYATTNGSRNGPAVYATEASWLESEITWKNRPARTSDALDNKTNVGRNTWVEYEVTSHVTSDGSYSFVLAADSADAVRFSSRQGGRAPELVIIFTTVENTLEPTSTNTATPESGETSTPEPTDTSAPDATSTEATDPTATEEPAETATHLPEPTDTITSTPEPDTATPTDTEAPTSVPTSTVPGSAVFVGAGDISLCTNNNDEATAKLLDNIPGTVFTTGDNVYPDGSYTQYINCYDPTWGRHKARTKPIPGNHEYHTSGAAGYFQYFNAPAYFAFNLGTWRIYALNSEISVTATSPQIAWLKDDLATHPNQCVLAYWHKPRWSSGSNHGSNSSMQTLWQTLYDAGAELVLNGHEHNYERFGEMNSSGATVSEGMREFVVGTGGANLYPFGTVLSTSQVRNNTTYGVLKLTLHPGSYDWEFVPVAGATFTDSGGDTCR